MSSVIFWMLLKVKQLYGVNFLGLSSLQGVVLLWNPPTRNVKDALRVCGPKLQIKSNLAQHARLSDVCKFYNHLLSALPSPWCFPVDIFIRYDTLFPGGKGMCNWSMGRWSRPRLDIHPVASSAWAVPDNKRPVQHSACKLRCSQTTGSAFLVKNVFL